jgi:transcriptional regulator with XRE-family HTH domain
MDTLEEIGRRLTKLRGERKLREICAQVEGISVSRLSNWEHATRMIGVDEAKRLAPVLGTTAEYILTLTDEQPDPHEIALLSLFKNCDERGKKAIIDAAHTQASFTSVIPTTKTVDTPKAQPVNSPVPDPRKKPARGPQARLNESFSTRGQMRGKDLMPDEIDEHKRSQK